MTQPSLHLIKLCVGLSHLSELQSFQRDRAGTTNPCTGRVELAHITRHAPRRAAELLTGGSIYWVMSGLLVARQRLLELRSIEIDGKPYCAIVYDRLLVPVARWPRRPFQGWRYLRAEDAPPDLTSEEASGALSSDLHWELAKLGLL